MQPVSAVPANLRLANQTALLGQLLGRKAASRAELAKATGMSKPTTGKIIDDLMHAGVVEEIKHRWTAAAPASAVRASSCASPPIARGSSSSIWASR